MCLNWSDWSDWDLDRARMGIGAFEVNAIDRYAMDGVDGMDGWTMMGLLTEKEEEGCVVCKGTKEGAQGKGGCRQGEDWGLDWKRDYLLLWMRIVACS